MTITSTVAENTYQGAGSAGPFAYTFMIFQYSHLQVTTTDTNGVVTPLVYGVDFTATGVLAKNGGTVTLTVALAVGWTLTIQRVVPLVQLTDLRNQGTFRPETYEDALDYQTMAAQTLQAEIAAIEAAEAVDTATVQAMIDASTPGGGRTVTQLGTYLANNAVFNVKDFGAKGDGVTDDTAAILDGMSQGFNLFFPDGKYMIEAPLPLGRKDQHIWGQSIGGTVLVPFGAGCHGFTEAGSDSACVIENMSIGDGTPGTGSGLYFPTQLMYRSAFRNLLINMGADAVLLGSAFSALLDTVESSSVAGHAFNVNGGVGTTLINCYANTVATTGKYGFRIPAGAVLIGCNGLNSGSNWARFGSTVALDGVIVQFDVSLIRCNYEAYTDAAIDLVNQGTCRIDGGSFNVASGNYDTSIRLWTSTGQLSVTGPKFFTSGGTRAKRSDIWTAGVNYPVILSEDVAAFVSNIDGNGTLYPSATQRSTRGLWTPVLAGTSTAGTNTYSVQGGNYTINGRMVTVDFTIVLSGNSVAMVGNLVITGLPFPCNASFRSGALAVGQADNITLSGGYSQFGGSVTAGESQIRLQQFGSNVATLALPEAAISATTGGIRGSISYMM